MKYKIYCDRKKVYVQIRAFVECYKSEIRVLFLIQFFFLIGAMLTPYLYGLLIDEVMVSKNISVLKWICLGYFALFCLDSVLVIWQRKVQVKTYNSLKLDIRKKIWNKYITAPFKFHEKYGNGDLKQRIDTDVNAVENFLNEQMIKFAYDVIATVVYLGVIFIISWKLALFSLLMVPVAFWMTKQMAKGSGESWGRYRENYGDYESWLQGSLQNWKEIKALNVEEEQILTFQKHWRILKPDFYKGCLYFYINRSFIGFSDFFITKMNLYFVGGLLIFSGNLKIGMLFVFIKYYEKFFLGITDITNANMRMAEYGPSLTRIIEILEIHFTEKKKSKAKQEIYQICFDNVNFGYEDSDKEVLKNINLSVAQNDCVAIVGKSGNGKTTLIKLLLGMYDNYQGNIFIGGCNVMENAITLKIAVVMQDSILFNMSIFENMRLVNPKATQTEIVAACKKAYIHEDIMNMPNQYNTMLGERGIQVSGGQKQRLAIARALLVEPDILIMDEATSALDTVSEQMINQSIKELKGSCTILLIAHRMSSILLSDEIIVIDESTIVEKGKCTDLMVEGTKFEQLFREQYNMA